MTDDELKQLVASLAESQKEAGRQMAESRKETDRQMVESRKETDRQMAESRKEIEKELKELKAQIGGLGNKFGSFTEGLALPSMEKILRQRFRMEIISPRVRAKRNGRWMEIDVLAYANQTTCAAYVVEVKSHLREEGIQQVLAILHHFSEFFPEHKDKALYGMIASVDVSEQMRKRVQDEGLYLARIQDDHFELQEMEGFHARRFNG